MSEIRFLKVDQLPETPEPNAVYLIKDLYGYLDIYMSDNTGSAVYKTGDFKCNYIEETIEGKLWVWGGNNYGQLGSDNILNESSPVQTISSGNDWTEIAGGIWHSMAIKTDGTLWLWGNNIYGRAGDNTDIHRSSPVQTITGGNSWSKIAAGYYNSVAIKTDGTLWLWGNNWYGQLGDNTQIDRSSPVQTISGGNNWDKISVGYYHSMAIKTDGTLWLWGYNLYGRLGTNDTISRSSPVQTISGGNNWIEIAAGAVHSTAIKTDGTLWLWGWNEHGQLGDNTVINRSSPVQTISGGNNWSKIATGRVHSMAIKTDGTLWVWGRNEYGRLGDNTEIDRSSPVQTISGGNNWGEIKGGYEHSMAIKTNGTLWTWGSNWDSQLGDNTNIDRSSPIQTISGGNNWIKIAAGGFHSMAISSVPINNTAVIWTWGINTSGQLCDGTYDSRFYPDRIVSDIDSWDMISINGSTLMGINDSGLYLCGGNVYGQLGNGDYTNTNFLVETIYNTPEWSYAHMAGTYSLAIKTDGSLWAWGWNLFGQLGDNSTTTRNTPVQIAGGGLDWKMVGGRVFSAAAIKTDGTLWTWGGNFYGQLANGNFTTTSSPAETIAGGTDWDFVSCGSNHMAAIKTNNTLWTWGFGSSGQLGTGYTDTQTSPNQTIVGGNNWIRVSAGADFCSAIKDDNTLWMWGNNANGQLAMNSVVNILTPIQTVSGGNDWYKISAGDHSTAGIKTDGTLWVWGVNSNGQLGTNDTESRSSPVQTMVGGSNWLNITICSVFSAGLRTD